MGGGGGTDWIDLAQDRDACIYVSRLRNLGKRAAAAHIHTAVI
jgi:hypothetical protein